MNGLNNGLKKTCLLAFLLVLFAVSPVFGAETALSTGDISGTEQVTAGISYLEITPVSADILIEDTVQLTAAAYDSEGQETSCTGLIWESSDETVGTVDSAGLFTALSPGTSTVTVFCGELNSGCTITVSEDESESESVTETESESESGNPDDVSPEEESPENLSEVFPVEVSPSESELIIGDEQLFTASAFNESGSEVADAEFTWAVSDETVGTIDSTGLFTALAEGTVNVTATAGDFSADAVVTVSGAEIPEATLVPTPEPTAEAKTITEVISSISAEESFGGVIPAVDNVYLKVANAEGAYYNCWGNQTYRIEWNGGGENSLHITDDSRGSDGSFVNYGQLTYTNDLTGTFYVSTTGGRGYQDDILLMVAVNGTVPDDFRLRIHADGYQWTPNSTPHQPPAPQDIVYEEATIDEWFEKDDLIYGPQTWRPAVNIQYPIFPYQDVSDTSNKFSIMLVDLNGGVLTEETLRIRYEAENLNTMLAFNVYGYARNVLGASMSDIIYNTTEWTNRLTGTGHWSGWYVSGTPLPDAASVIISPSTANVPLNGKKEFTATAYDSEGSVISGAPITWSSSDTGIGTINDEGLFTPVSVGSTTITASAKGAFQTAEVTVSDPVEIVLTTITLDPSEIVMYTDHIENCTFSATGYDQFGDEITPLTYTWTSSELSVGTIDNAGEFTGLSEGTTIIRATNGSISGNATVTIRPRPDWSVPLTGAVSITLDREQMINLSDNQPALYLDNRGINWKGVDFSRIIGLVDDHDPSTFNKSLASREYTISLNGSAAGVSKEVNIISTDLLDSDMSFILAYMLDGYEIPEAPVDGRTYWPLKLVGSGVSYRGKTIEQISDIIITFGPDINNIVLTPESADLWAGDESIQFSATAYDRVGIELQDIDFKWSSSNESVGIITDDGTFTPLCSGTTVVTAHSYGVSGTANVNVKTPGTEPVTWYVDGTGAGDFLTIQDAVDYAYDNDIIVVRDGIYSEQVAVDRPLTITSENGPEKAIVSPEPDTRDTTPVFSIVSDNVTIKNLGIETAYKSYGIALTGYDNLIVEGNIINSPVSGAKTYGIDLHECDNSVIRNNTVLEQMTGISVSDSSSNCIIDYNNVTSNTKSSYGIYLFNNVENVIITHNNVELLFKTGKYPLRFYKGINNVSCEDNYVSGGVRTVTIFQNGNVRFVNNTVIGGYQTGMDIQDSDLTIMGNYISGGSQYSVFSPYTLPNCTMIMNEIVDVDSSKFQIFNGDMYSPINSTTQYTYEYKGGIFTGFIGNNYSTYTGFDTNGDGIGETPFEEDGAYDYHPLTGTYSDYRIISEGKVAPESQNTTLNFKGLGVKAGAGGKQTATVNTTLTETTQNGNNVTISRANYDLVIEYDSDMAVTGDQITGTVKSVQLKTENLMKCNCSAGNVSGSLVVNLNDIPDGAGVDSSLMDGATADQNAAFQLAASGDGLKVDAVACTLTVVRQNLANGNDVASATIRLSADKTWVDAHGGNESIKIIRCAEDGTKEILDTKSIAFDGVMETFEAVSPNGLSVFGLSATSTASAPSSGTTTGSSSGGGGSSSIGTSRIDKIGAGDTGVFTLGETAISSVELLASAEIPEMMLTSEKVSKPSGIDAAPGEVYQYIQINEYLAPEGSMQMATLKFSVDKGWLSSAGSSASGVKMYRYDEDSETWVMLSTVANGETDSGYKFFADTPSFSLFAVTAEKGASSSVSSGTTPSAEPDSGISSGPQTNVEQTVNGADTPAKASGSSVVFAVIAVFAIIAVCGVVYRFTKPEKK